MSHRRIARVLDLRQRELDAARAALEAAVARSVEADVALAQARAEVARAEHGLESLELPCAGDLVVASAHIDSCRRAERFAAKRRSELAALEASARAAVNDARIRVRQVEMWRDQVMARAETAREVEERKLHDALAARSAREGSR
jgi:hypothetical protein